MPIPNYNQDITYHCTRLNVDVDEYDPSCSIMFADYCKVCKQCSYCRKNSYTMVVQDESQKEFISPSRKK